MLRTPARDARPRRARGLAVSVPALLVAVSDENLRGRGTPRMIRMPPLGPGFEESGPRGGKQQAVCGASIRLNSRQFAFGERPSAVIDRQGPRRWRRECVLRQSSGERFVRALWFCQQQERILALLSAALQNASQDLLSPSTGVGPPATPRLPRTIAARRNARSPGYFLPLAAIPDSKRLPQHAHHP